MNYKEVLYESQDIQRKDIIIFRCDLFRKQKTYEEFLLHVLTTINSSMIKTHNNSFTIHAFVKNVKLKNVDHSFIICMSKILKEVYKNQVQNIYVYNLPKFLRNLYNLIKGLMDKRTTERIILLDTNDALLL